MYKKRLIGLDIYRIIAVLVIFLFHSSIHIKCTYGILNDFVRVGAIYVVAFFILSGYVLFVSWHTTNLTHIDTIKKFYIKRGLGILPLYYVVSLLYMIFLGKETLKDNLLLAPIEILGLQSVFSTIFHISHNNGTWFVSCLMLCYLIYPYIQEILKQIQIKDLEFLFIVL